MSGLVEIQRDAGRRPISGVRVVLQRRSDMEVVAESVSAGDGTYYLDNVLPGAYFLYVDPETAPDGFEPQSAARAVEVLPTRENQQINADPFLLQPKNEG
jgi:hypothetical protein